MEPVVLLVAIGLLSISCQFVAYKLKLPAILPLLIVGVLVGPVFGVLQPDQLFGDLLFPFVSLAVAIILFEGALSLNFEELGKHGRTVTNLCSLGVLVTWLVVTPVAHFTMGMSWQLAALFGAIVTVTGPTVIMPMLRTVRPTNNVAQILRWEGIVIDPIGALFAVLVFEFILSSQNALSHTLTTFGLTLLVGCGIGAICGFLLGFVLKHNFIPPYLRNTAVLTIVLGAFEGSNLVVMESGLLTVTVMGMWLANTKNLEVEDIIEFKETLSVLLISALFIILAARVNLQALLDVAREGIWVMLALIVVARPLGVMISSFRSTTLIWQEKALLSWIAPRGIIAAAVSSLFALKLEQKGLANVETLVPLVFLVIIVTVVLQSLTSSVIAKHLGVQQPAPSGYLLFGANAFSRMLAKEMQEVGVNVKIADPNWEAISTARMNDIPTYFGNPASEHARQHLDMTGIGHLLILSPYRQLNPIVLQHYQHILESEKVMAIDNWSQKDSEKHLPNESYARNLGLFNGVSYSKLASEVAKGAVIKRTNLTEEFDMQAYSDMYKGRFVPLVAIDKKGKLKLFNKFHAIEPQIGWQVISLVSPEQQAAVES